MTAKESNTESLETLEQKIYHFLLAHSSPSGRIPARTQVAAALGCSRASVSTAVRNLALAGQLRAVNGAFFLAGVLDPAETAQQLELVDAGPVELVKVGDQSIPDDPAEAARVIQRLRTAAAIHQAENERLKAELRLLKLARSNGELQRDLEHEQQRNADLGRDLGRALAAVRYWQSKAHVAEYKAGLALTPLAGMPLFVDQPAVVVA